MEKDFDIEATVFLDVCGHTGQSLSQTDCTFSGERISNKAASR